jgi:hypothetical protein
MCITCRCYNSLADWKSGCCTGDTWTGKTDSAERCTQYACKHNSNVTCWIWLVFQLVMGTILTSLTARLRQRTVTVAWFGRKSTQPRCLTDKAPCISYAVGLKRTSKKSCVILRVYAVFFRQLLWDREYKDFSTSLWSSENFNSKHMCGCQRTVHACGWLSDSSLWRTDACTCCDTPFKTLEGFFIISLC